MEKFKKSIINMLMEVLNARDIELEIPPDKNFGDYAFPCFKLAKENSKKPDETAKELEVKIKPTKIIEKVKATGPFLNFFINKIEMAQEILVRINKEKNNYGKGAEKKRVMVEFCSPNTNKPLHLGHVRNCVIGESISNILKFSGSHVTKACLVNDKGVHICKSMLAYRKWGKNMLPDVKPDYFVGRFYVMFAQKAREAPELENEAQALLQKWEKGDKDTIKLWKRMNSWVYDGFKETYNALGVAFDKYYHESLIYKEGKELILDGLERGVFSSDDSAVVADLERYGLPKKVLIRSDGTTIYITQDVYLAKLKFDEYKLDESIYVVGSEQNLHFKELFKILELLGYRWADKCRHLSHGMVFLPEGKMKSREGKVVDADDIIRQMKELARFEIAERHKDIEEKELLKREMQIGLGALKFYLLRTDIGKDMHYDPKESIRFDGETGPYVQYTHARLCSVLRKHGQKVIAKVDFKVYDEKELEIIRMLSEFPEAVKDASTNLKPSAITRYLLDLCQKTNEFYHSSPILKAPAQLQDARILLIDGIKRVIEIGLNLLGIEAPHVM